SKRDWSSDVCSSDLVTVDGAPFSLFGVTGPSSSQRLACWFVGLVGDHGAWDDERRAVAAELAGLAARHRAHHEEGRRAVRRSARSEERRVGKERTWR